mgnify:CR=1 FL=1
MTAEEKQSMLEALQHIYDTQCIKMPIFNGDYKKVQKYHRKHSKHHPEYLDVNPNKVDWEAMMIDWECSRFTKEAQPNGARVQLTLEASANVTWGKTIWDNCIPILNKWEI